MPRSWFKLYSQIHLLCTITQNWIIIFNCYYQMPNFSSISFHNFSSNQIVFLDFCRVSEDLTVKIAGFVPVKESDSIDYYHMGKKTSLPVKWMALEALTKRLFSEKSDVVCIGKYYGKPGLPQIVQNSMRISLFARFGRNQGSLISVRENFIFYLIDDVGHQ